MWFRTQLTLYSDDTCLRMVKWETYMIIWAIEGNKNLLQRVHFNANRGVIQKIKFKCGNNSVLVYALGRWCPVQCTRLFEQRTFDESCTFWLKKRSTSDKITCTNKSLWIKRGNVVNTKDVAGFLDGFTKVIIVWHSTG